MEHTDTERLNWVLNYSPELDFEHRTGEYWAVWNDFYGNRNTMKGKSWRDCIDKILDQNSQ
jgi:hypothetical protein